VWLGKHLVDLIVEGAHGALHFADLWPTVLALGILAGVARAEQGILAAEQEIFAERVGNRAQQRFLDKAAGVDLGHFDNSEWHDRNVISGRTRS
jgi:hypothetical protein